jgi:hypothetical protein
VLFTLNFDPSKKSTTNSHPVRAYKIVISFSIKRSAPFLLNVLWGYSSTTITTSPGSHSGYSSDSPWNKYFSPWGAPLSTSISKTFFSLTTFFPLHALHFSFSSIYSPVPLQSLQGPVDWEYIPGPSIVIFVFMPFPLQPEHVEFAPFSPPLPSHLEQILSLFTAITDRLPL